MIPTNSQRVALRLKNSDAVRITLVLEPWASEYQLEPGDSFHIIETGGREDRDIELHLDASRLTVFAREGATMSVFNNGVELL